MSTYHDLAEAMREGATKRPQGFGSYFGDRRDGQTSCALGATYEGLKGSLDRVNVWVIEEEEMRDLLYAKVAHPVRKQVETVIDIIVDLNDGRQWTREAIADWLDGLRAT